MEQLFPVTTPPVKMQTRKVRRLSGFALYQNEWTEILVKEFGLQEKAAMQIDLPDYRPATRPSYHDIEKIIAWLKSKGAIPDYYPGENLVDTTFIPGTLKPQ